MQSSLLDRRRHPFYERGKSAEAEFFLARDSRGKPVGRIAAIINHRYLAHLRQRDGRDGSSGFFGFFDCVNSPEVARGLVTAAGDWLRRRGLTEMLGPASPSQNYHYGLLVDGHDRPHRFLVAYHPPYYADLLEAAGLRKAKDLLGLTADLGSAEMKKQLEQLFDLAGAAEERLLGDITVRSPDIHNFDAEVRTVCGLFNRVLGHLWGHCPVNEQELGNMARSLRRFAVPDALQIAEDGGRPVGLVLAAPDLNELIRRLKFRVGPVEVIELLFRAWRWRPECMRILVLGVARQYERTRVVPVIVARLAHRLLANGIRYIDAHLVLEDNSSILVPLLRYGFKPDRRYRIYRLDL